MKKPFGRIVALAELLFEVQMAKIADMAGFNTITSTEFGIFGKIAGVGKPFLLNTCSDVYELVPNSEIFPVIEKILKNAGIGFTVVYRMLDYSRFYADYTLKMGAITIGNKADKIYPVLRIEHSYNGLVKYKLTFGYFRLICSNGLTVPVEGTDNVNITITGKHTAKIKKSLEALMEKITYFTDNHERFTKRFHEVAERWIEKWEDRVEAVIDATGVGRRGFAQITDKIKEEAGKLYNGKVNDWLIYNGINYHIFNATTSEGKEYATAPNLRRDADEKVWDAIYKYPKTADLKRKAKKEKALAE